ncbi:MAG TPA: TonB-dependent receptor [Vicinamibacterales bacterium]|nr:TonB-dependent receptor [Vicinamibacterales bacterium]
MRISLAAAAVAVALVSRLSAQEPSVSPAPPADQPPSFEEQVEVVAVTPIHGVGLSILKIPANVQTFTFDPDQSLATPDVASLLSSRAVSVHTVDAQAGTFQPDLMFRGFAGSPLLGASEGIAVYQDGVRINEAFGDTVNWDQLPSAAIASINLMPGSNPLFGLNALGGALSIQTKDGFSHPGQRVQVTSGSFLRHRIEAQAGGSGPSFGYFVAGTLVDEGGWRDFSPSTIRSLFGDLAWRDGASAVNLGVTASSNDLTGNGTAPLSLLEEDWGAVFTHPDVSENDSALITLKARRQFALTFVEGVAYYRRSNVDTFNGDVADDLDSEEDDDDEGAAFDAVNNASESRANSGGLTGQITSTAPLLGHQNQFIAGGGFDASSTRFDFASEFAFLTPDRGTIGSGIFDEEASVDLDSRTMTGSAFLTDTWSPTARFTLTGAARFNRTTIRMRDLIGTDLSGDHAFWRINPSAGGTYQLNPSLNLYGSYAQSSRAPTPVELTCADPDDPCRLPNAFVSDPPLDQIIATTWEGGVRGRQAPFSWTVAAFASAASDDIIFVSSGTVSGQGHFENVPRTKRSGIEASVEYNNNRVSVFGSYTLQRAVYGTDLELSSPQHPDAEDGVIFVEEGSRLPGVPRHSGKAGLSARLSGRLQFGVDLRAQSGQFFRGDEANLLQMVPGFGAVNARARFQLANQIALLVEGQNLFNSSFYTFGTLGNAELVGDDDPRFYSPGAPHAIWAGIDIRF